jgi:hypothetical protein
MKVEEQNYSYKDLETFLVNPKILDGEQLSESEALDDNTPLDGRAYETYTRDDEYFASRVFTLTRGHLATQTLQESVEHAHDVERTGTCDEHKELRDTLEIDADSGNEIFTRKGDGRSCAECLYEEEEKAGRGFPSPFPSKSAQFQNLKLNIQAWCSRSEGWKDISLR